MKKQDLLYLASLAEFARLGPNKPPQRLAHMVIRSGGLIDWRGEVSILIGNAKGRPGLINNRSGMPLDDAAHLAWEGGFIPTQDRATIDEFLAYLDDDLSGSPVTSADDAETAYAYDQAEEARDALDSLGILGSSPAQQIKVERALLEKAERVLQ